MKRIKSAEIEKKTKKRKRGESIERNRDQSEENRFELCRISFEEKEKEVLKLRCVSCCSPVFEDDEFCLSCGFSTQTVFVSDPSSSSSNSTKFPMRVTLPTKQVKGDEEVKPRIMLTPTYFPSSNIPSPFLPTKARLAGTLTSVVAWIGCTKEEDFIPRNYFIKDTSEQTAMFFKVTPRDMQGKKVTEFINFFFEPHQYKDFGKKLCKACRESKSPFTNVRVTDYSKAGPYVVKVLKNYVVVCDPTTKLPSTAFSVNFDFLPLSPHFQSQVGVTLFPEIDVQV